MNYEVLVVPDSMAEGWWEINVKKCSGNVIDHIVGRIPSKEEAENLAPIVARVFWAGLQEMAALIGETTDHVYVGPCCPTVPDGELGHTTYYVVEGDITEIRKFRHGVTFTVVSSRCPENRYTAVRAIKAAFKVGFYVQKNAKIEEITGIDTYTIIS